jgi:hypothetical protein
MRPLIVVFALVAAVPCSATELPRSVKEHLHPYMTQDEWDTIGDCMKYKTEEEKPMACIRWGFGGRPKSNCNIGKFC